MPGGDTGEGDGGLGGGDAGAEQTPPMTEETRWRKRALDAEEMVKQLEARLAQAQQDLSAAREAMDAVERRAAIDGALWEAGAADVETARLLTEIAVSRMDTPDVRLAVGELAASKPFLFRKAAPSPAGAGGGGAPWGAGGAPGASAASAMSGRIGDTPPGTDLNLAAEQAAASGDRAALLRYLRLRRGVW